MAYEDQIVLSDNALKTCEPVSRRMRVVRLVTTALLVASCAGGSGTLGGREKCWPATDNRAPSLWRGILQIDATGSQLNTPEGDAIPLRPGTLYTVVRPDGSGELVSDSGVVAKDGDDVTLFGGAGADGTLVVCAVEELHQP